MSATAPVPELARIVKKWKAKRGSLIMALHEVQGLYGYVPRPVALQLARELGVPMARIYEVLTFYNYFKLDSPAKHSISVCMGTACYLKGGKQIMESWRGELGVKEGETTPDGEFLLQAVRCVGACGLAPVVILDGETNGKDTAELVPAKHARLREKG